MTKPIIAVTGATGAQGGAVVQALLSDGKFLVRGLTRNVNSEKAAALSRLGVEVVKADVDDESSLASSFAGAYGVFAVTAFWEHMSPERELQQLKNIADAAKAAGVQHVVASVLEDTRKYVKEGTMPKLMEHYYVPHFDVKGESIDYFLATCPCTPLITSFYYENFIHFGMGPKLLPDGTTLAISLPMGDQPLPMQAVEDIGRFACYLFKNKSYIGQVVGVEAESMKLDDVAKAFTKVLGKDVVYNPLEPSDYAALGFTGSREFANNFQYFRDCAVACKALRGEGLKALPDLKPFETWLLEHRDELL